MGSHIYLFVSEIISVKVLTMTEDIQLRRATLEDEEGILDITRRENLWAGMDYLPFALHNWLKEAEVKDSNRENYVLVLGEKIVGFRSVYFMRGRSSSAMFAFRVSRDIRGKGFGKVILAMMTDNLLQANPDLKTAISAKPDRDMTDAEIINPKHGKLLTVKADHTFKLKLSDLPDGTDKKDIEFVTRKKQIVLVDSAKESLSILTLPYPSSGGTRMSIDFFGECSELLKRHIQEQLMHLRTPETMAIIQERHLGEDIGDLFLSVF